MTNLILFSVLLTLEQGAEFDGSWLIINGRPVASVQALEGGSVRLKGMYGWLVRLGEPHEAVGAIDRGVEGVDLPAGSGWWGEVGHEPDVHITVPAHAREEASSVTLRGGPTLILRRND